VQPFRTQSQLIGRPGRSERPHRLASLNSIAQRSDSASIAATSSRFTVFIRMRLEWNVKRSDRTNWRPARIAGISVSIVVFELGTI
jgi:hypothetical protein